MICPTHFISSVQADYSCFVLHFLFASVTCLYLILSCARSTYKGKPHQTFPCTIITHIAYTHSHTHTHTHTLTYSYSLTHSLTHTLTLTQTEVVLTIQGLGIQISSTNWLGYTSSVFLPQTIIGDVIINEGITMVKTHKSQCTLHRH